MTTITRNYEMRNGKTLTLKFPAKYEVCSRCKGLGKHVNPNIDGNGLTREDFDNDPDFEEAYFSGVYDVQCDCCKGLRVTLEFDEDRATPRQKTKYNMIEDREDEARRDWESERHIRIMESGGYEY